MNGSEHGTDTGRRNHAAVDWSDLPLPPPAAASASEEKTEADPLNPAGDCPETVASPGNTPQPEFPFMEDGGEDAGNGGAVVGDAARTEADAGSNELGEPPAATTSRADTHGKTNSDGGKSKDRPIPI